MSLINSIFISYLNRTIKMIRIDIEAENALLKAEITVLKTKNKNLSQKLENTKYKKAKLQRELKKKTYGQSY
jgi:5-methylcytosine-specific restriction endonuclease McrBC GTP-binding regulatory subunit McrB